jgi:cytosine/adenosine deaminase-related metal-dependent hydrolase
MPATTLKARFLIPLDQPPIEGGVVTVEGDRISAVGTRPSPGAKIIDLGDVALLPGLINAHTHLEFSDLDRPLGTRGMRLVDWIRLVIARRSHTTSDLRQSIAAGLEESLRHGVTTVCDITTADLGVYPDLSHGPDVVAFLEVIGFSRARAVSALRAAEERIELSRRAGGDQPQFGPLTSGLSPHAPYTVGLRLLRDLRDLANRHQLPMAMHLAESREELELLATSDGAFRELLEERSMWDDQTLMPQSGPLECLLLLSRAPRCLVIHGTHIGPLERALLRQHRERMTLVYCPRTHAYFNSDGYPLTAALQAGVRVVLGTDSRASSPDLSILNEVRHAAAAHPDVRPSQLLRMATLEAAESLGRTDEIGSITPGKLAHLTAVPIDPNCRRTAEEAVIESSEPPLATWYRGVRMME